MHGHLNVKHINTLDTKIDVDKKNQIDVTFCILYFFFNSCSTCFDGRTTCQPVLATFLQPRHIPTRGNIITQSSAPDDGHMVARNMLSNY